MGDLVFVFAYATIRFSDEAAQLKNLSLQINTGVIIPEFTVVAHHDRNRSLIDCSEPLCTLKKMV